MERTHASRLLDRAAAGERLAAAELLPLVYDELRRLAASWMRDERRAHTLQPTALVHEAYVRLVDRSEVAWQSRNQFFVMAAMVMRNVLVDHARHRARLKRGGGWERVTFEAVQRTVAAESGVEPDAVDLLRLHEALDRLAQRDERKARLVELRFFAGFGLEESAEIVGMSRSTASEQWRMARAWLHRELRGSDASGA